MDGIQCSDASSNLIPTLSSHEVPINPLGSSVEGHNRVATLLEVTYNMPLQLIADVFPMPNPPVAPPTPNQDIRDRGNGVDSRISSGGVDPTTATTSKPSSASDINFSEISKNNPTPIKKKGFPTAPARKIIYFVDYSNDNEDWHVYDSDGAKGTFLDGIVDKVKYDLFDKDKNIPISMGDEGCDHNKEIRKFIPSSGSQIKAFTVSELKSELRRRGGKPNLKGNKSTFRYQITKATDENKTIQTENNANEKCLKGFPEGAKWKPLKPNE